MYYIYTCTVYIYVCIYTTLYAVYWKETPKSHTCRRFMNPVSKIQITDSVHAMRHGFHPSIEACSVSPAVEAHEAGVVRLFLLKHEACR